MNRREQVSRKEGEPSFHVYITSNTSATEAGAKGISSGNMRILVEFARRWVNYQDPPTVHLLTTHDGKVIWSSYNVPINCIISQPKKFEEYSGEISWHLANTFSGIKTATNMPISQGRVVVISASEFVADAIPAIMLKRRMKGAKWIAGFYLFAPNPLSENVYKGFFGKMKNILWYLSEKPVYWLVKKYADMVFTTNDLDRRRFTGGRIPDDRIITVGIGVDTELPKQVKEPEDKEFDAVFLGRFHPQKGLLELMDIWRIVVSRKKDAKLAIIGMGDLEDQLKEKIRNLALTDNAQLFGFRDGIDKIRILKNSRVIVEPSIYASGGLAAYDGLSCGLPGVSFDLPVWHSYYPKGFVRVPVGNFEAFAEAILRLVADQSHYTKMRNEALELAQSVSWDAKASNIYEKIKVMLEENN